MQERGAGRIFDRSERSACPPGSLKTLFILGHTVDDFAVHASYLNINRAVFGLDTNDFAFKRPPLDLVTTNAERRRLSKDEFR